MKNIVRCSVVAVVSSWLGFHSGSAMAQQTTAGNQVGQTLDVMVPVRLNYLLYLPADYEDKQNWPLVLFLHGRGERGDDLGLVKVHGPPKMAVHQKYPFILVSPQCPDGQWWQRGPLIALLDEIQAKYSVDPDRVYVTGLSMGGYGTWTLAALDSSRFAAVLPVCGGGRLAGLEIQQAKSLPIWAIHGAADPVVPVSESEALVKKLQKAGGDVRMTIYPNVGHNSWERAYAGSQWYEWLLRHRRGKSPFSGDQDDR